MKGNVSSRKVRNSSFEKKAGNFCCEICSKPLPKEYFKVKSKKPKGRFNVCSNDCEAIIWQKIC